MGEPQTNFFTGFILATLIGVLASMILGRWNALHRTGKQMFVRPPVPDLVNLRATTRRQVAGVGAAPDRPPLTILSNGCLVIFVQIVLLIGFGAVLALAMYWAFTIGNLTAIAWVGAFYAGVFGFTLGNIRLNWLTIINLARQLTRPPVPALKAHSLPNNAVLGAKPPLPAFQLVFGNLFEITWRVIWIAVLFCALVLAVWSIVNFISTGSFRIFFRGVFAS